MSCLASILSAQSSQSGSAKDTPRQLSISLHCIWHCCKSREETLVTGPSPSHARSLPSTTEKPRNRARPSVVLPSVVVVVSGRVVVIGGCCHNWCGGRCHNWCGGGCHSWCGGRCHSWCGGRCHNWCGGGCHSWCGGRCHSWCGGRCHSWCGGRCHSWCGGCRRNWCGGCSGDQRGCRCCFGSGGTATKWVKLSMAILCGNEPGLSKALQPSRFISCKKKNCISGRASGLFRSPQSPSWFPQHCPLSPLPGLPPQYSPSLFATASWMVSDVNHAQQSCSVAKTGPPFRPFSLYTRQRSVFNIISCPSKLVSLPMSLLSHWFLPAFPLTASSGIQPLASSET